MREFTNFAARLIGLRIRAPQRSPRVTAQPVLAATSGSYADGAIEVVGQIGRIQRVPVGWFF
ncbi:MAG: hypothetical protein KAX88_07915 [Rhodoferax sp.]|nr:hypothetical protein [Rhodoferax sp.]